MSNKMKKQPEIKACAFKEPQSGAWFYRFEYKWVQFGASKGYGTREEAETAADEHIYRVLENDK